MCVSILTAERVREVRMVEQIEEFCPELRSQPFPELPVLGDREVYIAESGIAEDVASHRAESAERRWNQEGLPIGVTTEAGERARRWASVISAVDS